MLVLRQSNNLSIINDDMKALVSIAYSYDTTPAQS